jgi:SAM-dependent methyltransferase
MDPRQDAAGQAPPSHDDPEEMLAQVRARLAEGARLTGPLAATFYRAVHALDPGATEDSLAILPGNRGVHLYDSLVGWASLVAGERVLDIGCGSGGAARSAARAVGADGLVVGLDISGEAIESARERTPEGVPVVYRRCAAEKLTAIPDRSFDCVVASLVLDQVTDLRAVIAEAYRALRPGGRMVASVMAFDRLRPMDAAFMGAVVAVVGRRAPGALAGRASRASFPDEPADRAAFAEIGMLIPEEQDVQLAAVMEDGEDAWRLFSRTYIAHLLDEEGKAELRKVLDRRTPHTLYLPVRFLRTRRPG